MTEYPRTHPRPLIVAALLGSEPQAPVDPLSGLASTDPLAAGASPADLAALEHALRIAEVLGGRCLAVTVGPPTAESMLREALAAGADAALRIERSTGGTPEGSAEDPAATAHSLDAAFRALPGFAAPGPSLSTGTSGLPHLVLCGDRPLEHGTGSVPAHLAARLHAAQALGLIELSAMRGESAESGESGELGRLEAIRRVDRGARERIVVPLPAVCSVEPTDVRLRRAALPAVLASRTTAIPVLTVPVPPVRVQAGPVHPYRPRPRAVPVPTGSDPRERLRMLTGAGAQRTPPRLIEPSSPAAAADALLAELRGHGCLEEETS
ncbi:mycofactocin-associated electron transfer flavoprotein beta subunit [Streptomyces sp. NPDC004647]|uniref:mycofactocin-associated electron transfer flavoprotein beta subunit n=1 Tax=Streptomyces sp. NPDC004647 TaxID=3154671 RepID=UPI0033A21423